MSKRSSTFLITLIGLIIALLMIPPALLADDLGTQGIDFEGRPIKTTAIFSGGFLAEDGLIHGDGNVNAANPVNISGQITVDPNHIGQLANLVVYVHYSDLADPTLIPLMLAEGGSILPWNSDITSLVPFVQQIKLQPTHSLEIYNGLLPESKIKIYFGYYLPEEGTLVATKLPIKIAIEALPEAIEVEALEDEESSEPQIDTTPLRSIQTEEDGRLVGELRYRWENGKTLKVGFDFDYANFEYTPTVCLPTMEQQICENAVMETIVKTASTWSQYGNIYFKKSSWNEADIRVMFLEDNGGSWSHVGTDKPKQGQTMNLPFSVLRSATGFRRAVLHEFGHAIGLHHEHNSPNVSYTWNEAKIIEDTAKWGWSEWDVQSNILESLLKGNSKSAFFTTEFDPNSIMIYVIPKGWVSVEDLADPQKCPDIEKSRYNCVSYKTELSEMDKEGIANFYPQRSQRNNCSYNYDSSRYGPGTALWDGHQGAIAFYNPTSTPVKVTLYDPESPQTAFASWQVAAKTNTWLNYRRQRVTLAMDWGIQVNDSPICVLKTASNWKSNYFQSSTTQIPGM